MKKILLGLIAAFALAFVAPVHAEEGAAGGDAPKAEKKTKKKKAKKGEGDAAAGGDAAGGDAAKK